MDTEQEIYMVMGQYKRRQYWLMWGMAITFFTLGVFLWTQAK